MKIQVEVTRPRRLPRTWRARALTVAVAALVVGVPVAWASHQFADVPNSNPHHMDISAIRGAGITQGCNPPTNNLYCPDQPVRRDQMASFIARGNGRVGYTESILDSTIDYSTGVATDTQVAFVNMSVPGTGTGATQFVKVDASVRFSNSSGAIPYGVNFYLARPTCAAGSDPAARTPYFSDAVRDAFSNTLSLSFVMAVPPGLRTWYLCGYTSASGRVALASSVVMTAATFPFGPTGGATLGEQAVATADERP